MFSTEMHLNTFIILVLQFLILFPLLLFFLSRPKDKSRSRFLVLTLTYILYNLFSGIFPDEHLRVNLYFQYILAYSSGILVSIYFIYYLYKEFNISPFKHFSVKIIFLVLTISFISLFAIPFYFTENLSFSRKLFIIAPLFVSFAFLYQVSKKLLNLYKTSSSKENNNRYIKIRILAGYTGLFSLTLMPVIVAIGDYQSVEQPVVNFGYIIMAITYLIDLVYKSRLESTLLLELDQKIKNKSTTKIPHEITQKILKGLELFEIEELFLKNDVTISSLSKEMNTNSKYLSKTINEHKNYNFNTYVNNLRIDYTIRLLNNESKYRNYTISSLAKEVGFNNSESFVRSFKQTTGKKPSTYIKELGK